MSPIDLQKLREQHPELAEVWNNLARLEAVLRRKPFIDVRLLRQAGLSPPTLTAAFLALAQSGDYRCVFKVEDPYDRTLQAGQWDRYEDIPEDLVDEADRHFRRMDADVIPVLIERHGK